MLQACRMRNIISAFKTRRKERVAVYSDLGTVFVHKPLQLVTPAFLGPLLTVTLVVHAVVFLFALIAGLGTVHVQVVGVRIAQAMFGPSLAVCLNVLTVRRLGCSCFGCRLLCRPRCGMGIYSNKKSLFFLDPKA